MSSAVCLDLVDWATFDGVAHVLSYGYRGSYPPHSHLMKTTLNAYEHDSNCSNLHGVEKVVDPSNFLPLWHKAPKREEKKQDQHLLVISLNVRPINIITSYSLSTSCSSPGTIVTIIVIGVNTCMDLTVSSGSVASGTPQLLSLTVSL